MNDNRNYIPPIQSDENTRIELIILALIMVGLCFMLGNVLVDASTLHDSLIRLFNR